MPEKRAEVPEFAIPKSVIIDYGEYQRLLSVAVAAYQVLSTMKAITPHGESPSDVEIEDIVGAAEALFMLNVAMYRQSSYRTTAVMEEDPQGELPW